MRFPLSLKIGLRYTRAKKRNHFISFISLLSMLCIALGVLVLITVLSVMNGFDQEIQQTVFSMVPSATISDAEGAIRIDDKLRSNIQALPEVKAVEPYISGQAVLQGQGASSPLYIMGVNPSYANTITQLSDKMLVGKFSSLEPGEFGIIIGQSTAFHLGVNMGDQVLVLTPQLNWSLAGVMPRLKRFTVVGIFHAGASFGYDDSLAFIDLTDAQVLYHMKDSLTGYQIKLYDPYLVSTLTEKLYLNLPPSSQLSDWTNQYENFFHAIAMEKTMMFLILLLIIAVAIFNLVSMLVMLVNEKQADIAIMRTLGCSKGLILRIFIVQGLTIGGVGTFLGVVGGVALSMHATEVVDALQNLLHTEFVSADIYFVNYLPSKLEWLDVCRIAVVTLVLSFLATLYPAYRASQVEPAKALRYE